MGATRCGLARALKRAAIASVVWAGCAAAQAQLPAWTRGATCYEIFVRSFYDSNGDGVGDLKGLIAKLDYINDGNPASRSSLGARCIWLMPVVASPSYHGYDATDYYRVNRDYGTNEDFKQLVAAAHRRGIRVLVDMVLNHTSNQHPWFQSAMRDTASPYRAWYRWSKTKPNEKGPWGQDVWYKSPVRDEYYYAVFWSGMPDLNYETPAVREEVKKIARFWLDDMGADGFRLDAVPFLMEDHGKLAGSPGTHALLHEYEQYLRTVKPDVYTVGEVYDSLGAVLPYYPEQLDSYFGFEMADSIIAAVRSGSARGLLAPVLRMQYDIPANRWSSFLRNHDQPRTRTELGGDMAKAKLASFLLLTLPGVPFVYYGEEIGMTGSKPDERIRTPMQWSRGHAGGFTTGAPWEALQPDSSTTNVAVEERDPTSLLALHRTLIHLRASNPALGEGVLVPLRTTNASVAAFLRREGDRVALIVANLGAAAAKGVALTSDIGAAPAGRWRMRSLLDGSSGAPLTVGSAGLVRGYILLPALAAEQGYLFELVR